jgi:hypothetical protein
MPKAMPKINSHRIFLPLVAMIMVVGCSLMPTSKPVEGQEREQVIASVEPLADNLFKGLNDADYTTFSRDFDPEMKKALAEKAFSQMAETFSQTVGKYQSRQVEKIEQIENLYAITYIARFEKENPVSIRLTVRQPTTATPLQVAGLWFDSPKLRTK